MTTFGFAIDNRNCIGCHACSTACKSENDVPLGVYRTWVKYTETGAFPDTQRHFQVTRCNHCSNPPCARICPTGAMYQRDDGIVEFNSDACIGCKACLQACPYDAIHIDPETHTAAKCHYCSHRTDRGLEPACVVVCPTHAIVAGDLDDPSSEISKLVARETVTVRKPEQGTAPKLFYIEGSAVNLVPTATERAPGTFAFADVRPLHEGAEPPAPSSSMTPHGPQPQGLPDRGPLQIGGRRAEHMVQVGYNAQHTVPWHWPVPAYLVTKGIGAGVFGVLAAAWLLGLPFHAPTALVGAALALVMIGATTGLLVFDLERPERFLYILIRPQWRSWLTRGAVALIGYSALLTAWFAAEAGGALGWWPGLAESVRPALLWTGGAFAAFSAVYTAFLFGQAEGRDLWQSPLLPPHLLVQAAMMGGAALSLMAPVLPGMPPELAGFGRTVFAVSLVADAIMIGLGEFGMSHGTDVAAKAAHAITHGRYRRIFWGGAVAVGHVVPLGLLYVGGPLAGAVAAACAIVGLYAFEYAFVMAPQDIPNS